MMTIDATLVYAAAVGSASGADASRWGMYKDAPHEGFFWSRFVREEDQSKYAIPMQFAVGGRPVKSRTARWVLAESSWLAGIAAIGYERAASENYKTFFFPSRPRGKFAGKPILFPAMLRQRRFFVPPYVVLRVALLWLVADVVIREKACLSRKECCAPTVDIASTETCQ